MLEKHVSNYVGIRIDLELEGFVHIKTDHNCLYVMSVVMGPPSIPQLYKHIQQECYRFISIECTLYSPHPILLQAKFWTFATCTKWKDLEVTESNVNGLALDAAEDYLASLSPSKLKK